MLRGQPMHLDELLRIMTKQGASDLHLKPTRPPLMRINGRLVPLQAEPLTPPILQEMVEQILTPAQKTKLEQTMSVDIGYGVHGLARFRGNIYMQRGTYAAAFRLIPFTIKSLEELELPDVLLDFCELPMGLVLVTGPTGSGKSTTLAAMVKHIAQRRQVHIITIEDPIEFLFSDGAASISQREVGTDTMRFSEALRNAMRQDPDVIMVGEMRDPETVSTVITAAETGHLVFSTLHTNSATQTVDRILDTFPPNQQGQVRTQLAQILKGVVSMKLLEKGDGKGRVAALEIMRSSPKINKMIEKGETADLHEEVESSVGYYRMQSMNQSLLALLVHGTISYEQAMRESPDPEDLSLKLRRMFPNLESKGGEMSPSMADFSEITELQQFKKLYEEQEEKQKMQLSERDDQIRYWQTEVGSRDERLRELDERMNEMRAEMERMRGDYKRLKDEAQQKIEKLMERIKELNQRLMGGGEASAKSGAFRG
jgi:twitching motility protein PilT